MEEMQNTWEKLEELIANNTTITVETSGFTTSGLVVYYEGIRGLIPASKIDTKRVENLEDFMNVVIDVKVIEADKSSNRITFSARDVILENEKANKQKLIKTINVGDTVEGTVESIQTYGAFLRLDNGISGLIHISQLSSEKRIKNPEEVLKVGDNVKALVIKNTDGKLSLSIKELEAAQKKAEEEDFSYDGGEDISTGLGDLLSKLNIK